MNALTLWGRVTTGKGGILGQHSPQAAGALARLGKLGDGSARRDVVVDPEIEIEALAVVLAVAIIARPVSVEVDGHERLAILSFALVPALTDALRGTHVIVQLGIAPAGLEAPILIFERAARAARLRAGLVGPDSIIALAIDAALDDLVGLARDVIAACADVASVRAS